MKIEQRSKRPYRMKARAEATAATGEAILDAAVELFWERPVDDIPLDEVASRAGVTVQTVVRHFESKEGLFASAVEREGKRVRRQRGEARVGDVDGAVRNLLDHYEDLGEKVLRLLAEEHRSPSLKQLTDRGRAYHASWCRRVFAPALRGLRGARRSRRLAQLIAVTDVFTWRLLRLDRRLSRRQTEIALTEMIQPLMGGR